MNVKVLAIRMNLGEPLSVRRIRADPIEANSSHVLDGNFRTRRETHNHMADFAGSPPVVFEDEVRGVESGVVRDDAIAAHIPEGLPFAARKIVEQSQSRVSGAN